MSPLYLIDVRLKADAAPPAFMENLFPLTFTHRITVITGENGSGKSTLLEALAIKLGCNAEGGGRNFHFQTEATHSELFEHVTLSKGYRKEKDLFFYRAETFYNLNTEVRRLDEAPSFDAKISTYYGGKDLHAQSHGEAMEALYTYRLKPNGLYLLDEPEASLSPTRQLAFILRIVELARQGAQFIIATHSPLLMFIPGCQVLAIDNGSIGPIDAEASVAVGVYKAVINSKGDYVRRLVDEEEA